MNDTTELKAAAEALIRENTCAAATRFEDAATPTAVLALIAENEALRVKLEVSEDTRQVLRGSLAQADVDIDALRKDAERYRWLREYNAPETEAPFICQQRLMFGKLYYAGPLVAEALDREVDSAIGKVGQP